MSTYMKIPTMNHFAKIVVVMAVVLLSQSCSSLNEARKLFIEDLVKNTPESDYIELTKADIVENKLDEHIEHWSELEGEIKKLILLGQDMEYVLSELKDDRPTSSLVAPLHLSEDDFVEKKSAANFNQELIFDSSSSSAPVLAAATPIATFDQEISPNEKQTTGSKFLNLNADLQFADSPAVLELNSSRDISDKFSGQQLSQSVSTKAVSNPSDSLDTYESCQSFTSNQINSALGKDFAVHLSSYRNSSNVKSGLKELQNRFNSALCGKVAIVKNVSVNGTQFSSLRMGPFAKKEKATNVCSQISDKKQYCKVTLFEGDLVQ